MELTTAPTTGPIYTYVHAVNQILRLLPVSNEEPFHGLFGRFLFMGYVGHAHQLSPIYWPEEYLALTHPPHDILRHVGFLLIVNDATRFSIYEIENGGSAFLNNCRTDFCAPNSHGGISPIWLLDQLLGVQFTPATHPHGFPPPAAFSETMFLDFEYEPTILEPTVFDILPTPTLPDDDSSIFDIMALASPESLSEAQPHHPDLPWIRTTRGDPLNKDQKLSLKPLLAASSWGRSIKLARYLFIGCFLVGTPVNPFSIPEAVCRQLITTSFLRALRFNQKTYDELSKEPLIIVNDDGSQTIVRWSYLRNRFQDFQIDVTSELRKITRGSTSVLAGFAPDEDSKMQKILELIVSLNSDDQNLVQEAICILIRTQAFREVLWAALLRPIAELAEGNARLADLYPDAIQTWTGYLRKGIVGVLITLMYQAFTLQMPSDSTNLKAPEIHPRIIAALDEMYMHPDRFAPFFQVARELPSLQESNVLVMDPKNKVPKLITDAMGTKRMKTLQDLEPIVVSSTSDFEVPTIASNFIAHWIDVVVKMCGYSMKVEGIFTTCLASYTGLKSAVVVPKTHISQTQLEVLAANMAATAPRAPGPIRKFARFCADGFGRIMQRLRSVLRRAVVMTKHHTYHHTPVLVLLLPTRF
ncbi:uncharacterized protein F5891DRAFT_988544 [Suillus fuscotomentosus]|uniref:Uncharacterized protein n=1 Tax=Suillus fuscotomentosus TaxID=1912939 RepID=A0AAD4HC59_9AGAM|nr:uncharacterized protein F5891DRAFT_988544 [Suillus fuscotomentosus]KAG1886928.1 hypothetical protein F5891DRAFT_988544 [Suillus fuscotomentosus]